MTWRLWFEFIMILVITNFLTWQISWYLSKKAEKKAEKYRQETLENSRKNIPYGDRFRQDFDLDPANWLPNVTHRRRKINGQWTED